MISPPGVFVYKSRASNPLRRYLLVPKKVFFTKGTGRHRNELASFEQALRDAGLDRCNLVHVSSILPAGCEIIDRDRGLELLETGQITFVVMARSSSNTPGSGVSSAVGLAEPADESGYGYLAEYREVDGDPGSAGDHAEDLAATMLATSLGIEFDSESAWNERREAYRASGKIIKTSNISESAEVDGGGLWTTVLAAAVFLV